MIVVKCEGKEFTGWTRVNVHQMLDTVASTFELSAIRTDENKELFQPFKFKKVEIWIIDSERGINEQILTGVIVNHGLSVQKLPTLETISGFSLPGILENLYMPQKLYPLYWQNVSIAFISKKITDYFGLELYVHEGAMDGAYEKIPEIKCDPSEPIKSFLSRICKDKGITVAHDNLGRLMLYRILNVIPVSSWIHEDDYSININTNANGQGLHSECTVIEDADFKPNKEGIFIETEYKKTTVKSTLLTDFDFPLTVKSDNSKKEVKDGKYTSLRKQAERILAEEAVNMPITINKLGWDFSGRIVRAGFFLNVEAPSVLVESTKFVVNDAVFTLDEKGQEELNLSCVLPCVYTGKLPYKNPYI